jgi:hypothetical protein
MLTEIYDRVIRGFDSADLKDAQALLGELGAGKGTSKTMRCSNSAVFAGKDWLTAFPS